jgi:glycerophosphoryl diester phosphodiesterase
MAATTLRIAHRGMPRQLPENTLPSFAAALAAGADGIELDVHSTADDVVIVHHDPTIGVAEIRESTWSALRAMEISPGVRVPTLTDVCRLVNGSAELFVEIKGSGIETHVLRALAEYAGPVAIHSFDHGAIRRLAQLGVSYRLGLLYEDDATSAPAQMIQYGALDVWPHHSLVTPRLIHDVHATGGRVIPWTVNELALARRLASWGVDGVCTDDVGLLEELTSEP